MFDDTEVMKQCNSIYLTKMLFPLQKQVEKEKIAISSLKLGNFRQNRQRRMQIIFLTEQKELHFRLSLRCFIIHFFHKYFRVFLIY